MKLINNNKLLELEFSEDELNLFDRIIDIPMSAFGLDQLIVKTKLDIEEIRIIKKKIHSLLEKKSFLLTVSYSEFASLKKIFKNL